MHDDVGNTLAEVTHIWDLNRSPFLEQLLSCSSVIVLNSQHQGSFKALRLGAGWARPDKLWQFIHLLPQTEAHDGIECNPGL